MTLGAPLGLLALLALPAVVVLHLFRRRFRERRAAGLFLFAPDALASDAGRRRTRLLRTPSLWLELLAALAAALLLARPLLWESREPPHLVLALDGSASLAAQGEHGPTDAAVRAFARDALADLPSGGRATVVVTGTHPDVLAGPAARPAEALAALDAWRPVAGDHAPT